MSTRRASYETVTLSYFDIANVLKSLSRGGFLVLRERGESVFGVLPKVFHNCGKYCGNRPILRCFNEFCLFSWKTFRAKV